MLARTLREDMAHRAIVLTERAHEVGGQDAIQDDLPGLCVRPADVKAALDQEEVDLLVVVVWRLNDR